MVSFASKLQNVVAPSSVDIILSGELSWVDKSQEMPTVAENGSRLGEPSPARC